VSYEIKKLKWKRVEETWTTRAVVTVTDDRIVTWFVTVFHSNDGSRWGLSGLPYPTSYFKSRADAMKAVERMHQKAVRRLLSPTRKGSVP